MSELPTFVVSQPNGPQMLVDLSAPGAFGDFSFRATNLATDRTHYFDAYHTGEAWIFRDVLHTVAFDRPGTVVLDDIDRIRRDVLARTSNLTATTISEHTFDPMLFRITGMLSSPPPPSDYRAHAGGQGHLVLQPSADTLRFTLREGPTARPRDPHVEIPTDQLWQLAAGMIWRSYSDTHSAAPLLTRFSTTAYEAAVAAFEKAIRESG